MEVEIRPYREGDLEALLSDLRDMDRIECEMLVGRIDPLALRASIDLADWVLAAEFDGELAVLFGLGSFNRLAGIGVPWLVGTRVFERAMSDRGFVRQFARLSRSWFDAMAAEYPELENVIYAENRVVIRWLRWLGFTVGEPEPMGPHSAPFCRFTYEGESLCVGSYCRPPQPQVPPLQAPQPQQLQQLQQPRAHR